MTVRRPPPERATAADPSIGGGEQGNPQGAQPIDSVAQPPDTNVLTTANKVRGQRLSISAVPAHAFEDLLAHFGSRVRVAQWLSATQKAGDR